MIRYQTSLKNVAAKNLDGFFVGWPNRPSTKTHLTLLKKSAHIVLAIDDKTNHVVGFITAMSDGVLAAYIPFLEVLPTYRTEGIGGKLLKKMLRLLRHLYMIDLTCDEVLQPYYVKFGLKKAHGMVMRNYKHQSGN